MCLKKLAMEKLALGDPFDYVCGITSWLYAAERSSAEQPCLVRVQVDSACRKAQLPSLQQH